MKGILPGISLLFLATAGFAYQDAQSGIPEQKGSLEGRILNLNTGAPIGKALVQLTGIRSDVRVNPEPSGP